MNEPSAKRACQYDAFISYNHAADGRLAPAVQKALQRFGQPWYARSVTQVFRDQTGLALTPDLWGEIQQRLQQSECFVLLACPEAAQSQWVEKEIQFWLDHRKGSPLLIVLTGGTLSWSKDDFDWDKTSALPRSLQNVFPAEPLWADLSWAKTKAELSLRHPRFFVEIAKLAAGMRRLPLDTVFSEAAIRQRNARRLLWAAVASLVVLTIAALGAATVSFQAKHTADRLAGEKQEEVVKQRQHEAQQTAAVLAEEKRQRLEMASAQLAAKASSVRPDDPELSILLALEAVRLAPTQEAERALRQTLLKLPPPLVLTGHSGPVWSAQFSADGKRILTSGEDGTVRFWDAFSGTNILTLPVLAATNSGDGAFGILGDDGDVILTLAQPESLAVGYWQSPVLPQLRDATTGVLLASISNRFVVNAALSPDHRQIATAGFDASAKLWDARTGKVQFDLAGHDHRVASVSFSSNGNWVVTGSWDGTARIWDAHTGRSLVVLPVQTMVGAVAFSPDGKKVLTLSGDRGEEEKYLQLWDWASQSGSSSATFTGHEGLIRHAIFSPDGKRVVTAGADGTARIWDPATGKCLRILSGEEHTVNAVDVSQDGKWVVTTCRDEPKAVIWDAVSGEVLIELGSSNSYCTCIVFSPDGKRIFIGTGQGAALIFTARMLGSIEDLLALAQARSPRSLTREERQKYLSASDGN